MTDQDVDSAAALAMARQCADAMWANDHCSKALGMSVLEVAPGFARIALTVRQDMLNGQGNCHGGIMFTLADSAFAFACNTFNQFTVAQHCSISFLHPVGSGEQLTATARERWREGRGGIYDVIVTTGAVDRYGDGSVGDRGGDPVGAPVGVPVGKVVAEFRGHSRTVKGQHIPDATRRLRVCCRDNRV